MFTQLFSARDGNISLRVAITMIIALFCVLPFIATAEGAKIPRKYAGIVVDAKSGKTLYASAADSLRYPASVSKVMTLYILFQELEAGHLKLSTKMTVSKHAAAAVPTKLGLRPGATISVEDAIGSLVTLSANDMARVIAEHISGSESAFAKRMTDTAHALGMSRTTYHNASGLPDSGQITTVRDQSRLAIAIYQHFPKYYEYFQTRSFKYGGRTYGNHNNLLGQNGVDGIKTGYINASGYNLMTAARKDGRHLVVIAFGFNSGASRNAKVASLVKKYLPKSRSGDYVRTAMIAKPGAGGVVRFAQNGPITPAPLPSFRLASAFIAPTTPLAPPAPLAIQVASVSKVAPFPLARPVDLMPKTAVAAVTQVAASSSSNTPEPRDRPLEVIGAWIGQTLRFEPGPGNNGLVPPAPIGQGSRNQTVDLLTSGSIGDAPKNQIDSWVVQVGAASNADGADQLIGGATNSLATLADYRSYVEKFEKNGQTFYRARFAGFAGRDQATSACDELKKNNMSCLALQG